jgi:branched-subunit amino acid ABC-type transport system permease component
VKNWSISMVSLLGQLAVYGLIWGALYALLGLSWNIIYTATSIFHFAHALVFSFASYAAVLITMDLGLPLPLGVIGAIVAGVIVGWAIERGIYRPLRRLEASPVTVFVASLGTLIVGEAAMLIIFKPLPRKLVGFPIKAISTGSITFTTLQVATVAISAIVILGTWLYLKKTKSGKGIQAVGSNEEMAEVLGINRDGIYLLVFAIGSGAGALGGVLYALDGVVTPMMGMSLIFPAFIVTFVGGVGSISGVVIAGLILGMAENLCIAWLPSDYKVIVAFAILLFVIIIRPRGLFGSTA